MPRRAVKLRVWMQPPSAKSCNQRPFQPVILHLADGRALEVSHPEFMSVSQSGRRVIVEKADDTFETVDALLINSVEVNGRRERP